MRGSRLIKDRWLVAIGLVATTGIAGAAMTLRPALRPSTTRRGTLGHPPAFTKPPLPAHPAASAGATPAAPSGSAAAVFQQLVDDAGDNDVEIPASLLAPLATGEFVNFESPAVHPLELSSDGQTLYVANTPNNSLVVIDTAGGLRVQKEIFVGLEPVSLRIQPGTNDNIVWVANMVSDTASVVDVAAGKVIKIIAVGDEPVNVLFNGAGTYAFVVIQGSENTPDSAPPTVSPFVALGHVVTIDAGTHQVISNTFLDCNTPRAAVYDTAADQLIVAALHSGNNTTVAGQPVELHFITPPPIPPPVIPPPVQGRGCGPLTTCVTSNGCLCLTIPNLWVAQQFSATAPVFDPNPGQMSELSPWPDDAGSNGGPLVERIVPDDAGDWFTIANQILVDSNGQPKPAMVALMNAEFGITNADEVIAHISSDAKNTLDHDLIVLDASNPAGSAGAGLPLVNIVSNVGTTLNGMDRNPVTSSLFVSNMEALNLVRLGGNLKGHFIDHFIEIVDGVDQPNPSIVDVDLHAGIPNFHDVSGENPVAKQNSLANPHALAFHDNGLWAAVASLGMDRIGILSGLTGAVLGRVDVPAGPRGLAIDSGADLLYVWCRHASTVAVVDVTAPSNPAVVGGLALFTPEPQFIRDGRQFHYSTAVSYNGAHACDSCHMTTDFDRVAWDLGSNGIAHQPGPPNLPGALNHPLKGPMVTQSLRGLDRHEPLHWRGDKPVFQDFNEAFKNLLGGEELPTEDIDAYNAFIKSVVYRPNPYFKRTNAYKNPRALSGMGNYLTFCNGCHQLIPALGNEVGHDGAFFTTNGDGGINAQGFFGQLELVTQLRDVHKKFIGDLYNGFGMIHDGREEREDNAHPIQTFLDEFFPVQITSIGVEDQLDLIATLNAFPSNVMNVVGWEILIPAPPVPAQILANIDVMIAQYQKEPSHCDVVAKGVLAGRPRGFNLIGTNGAGEPLFQSDLGAVLTLDQLLQSVGPPDSLIFAAVPPGSGKRIGIDQDTDGLLDGLDPMPQHDNSGDFDVDGDVDLPDYAAFQRCFTDAGGGPVPPSCLLGDTDEDNDVDDVDYATIQKLHTGPM